MTNTKRGLSPVDVSLPTTTRKQLRGYGATHYLARRLTASLTPTTKSGTAYVYAVRPVITAIRDYAQRTRIQSKTKQTLNQILAELLIRLDNVTSLPPTGGSSDISQLAQQVIESMHRTDKAMAEMKATVASMNNHGS